VLRQTKAQRPATDPRVHAEVVLGHPVGHDGFALRVRLTVEGVDDAVIQAAHEVGRLGSLALWPLRSVGSAALLALFLEFCPFFCSFIDAFRLGGLG